jgi:hypothetical protein
MYIFLRKEKSYFAKNHSDSTKMFSETDIINMLEFLIDNIFVINILVESEWFFAK